MNDRMALTVDEASKLLGISRNAVYEEVKAGRLPHRRTGTTDRGRILIGRAELEKWLAGSSQVPTDCGA